MSTKNQSIRSVKTASAMRRCILLLLCVVQVSACTTDETADRQATVASKGAEVMPFDLDRTTHIFEKQATGGKQQVLSDDNDAQQIKLIQAHLQEEAQRFGKGDFHDPQTIHGDAMPGLHDMMMGYDRLKIEYSQLDQGGQIVYSTSDPEMIKAVHAWFDAQVSDHGAHAQGHH